ncbi:MAG: hypothetical protein N4A53_09060 [Pelagimonas sp.]|jgi:hypothetical protein|nr:hypothetical protein [Pelagimonas sp.]
MRWILALTLSLMPGLATAQDFPTRDGDVPFTRDDLLVRLRGADLVFYDNGVSRYYEDGRYSYTFYGDEQESAGGYYEVREGGIVCVEFITGQARCDKFVMNGARLVLIDQKGDRYPVRPDR